MFKAESDGHIVEYMKIWLAFTVCVHRERTWKKTGQLNQNHDMSGQNTSYIHFFFLLNYTKCWHLAASAKMQKQAVPHAQIS